MLKRELHDLLFGLVDRLDGESVFTMSVGAPLGRVCEPGGHCGVCCDESKEQGNATCASCPGQVTTTIVEHFDSMLSSQHLEPKIECEHCGGGTGDDALSDTGDAVNAAYNWAEQLGNDLFRPVVERCQTVPGLELVKAAWGDYRGGSGEHSQVSGYKLAWVARLEDLDQYQVRSLVERVESDEYHPADDWPDHAGHLLAYKVPDDFDVISYLVPVRLQVVLVEMVGTPRGILGV
jgi:hypothetical protein